MEATLRSVTCDIEVMVHLAQLMLDQLTIAQATIDQALEDEALISQQE